jgi:hypothetical protein
MTSRSWVLILLLVPVVPSASAAQAPVLSPEEALCDPLNTTVYGFDGRHGLALTSRLLNEQIAYADQLIAHSQSKQTADLRTLQQWQSRYPTAKIRDFDLEIDRDLLTRFGSMRQQLEAERKAVSQTIAAPRNELQRRGCQERVDPKTGKNYDYETTPVSESSGCAAIRRELLTQQEGLVAARRALAFSTLVHNVLEEEQGLMLMATSRPNSDLAAQLRINDAALVQLRSSNSRDEAQDESVRAVAMRVASTCPDVLALLPKPSPLPAPSRVQPLTVTRALRATPTVPSQSRLPSSTSSFVTVRARTAGNSTSINT